MGEQLWRDLPAVHRGQDNGDLLALLTIFGGLLDQIRATLDQRLADCFPGDPAAGEDATLNQAWLLPYFARLVDASLRSPHATGRRDEVANAIDWRKRKGTLALTKDIAEAMTGPSEAGDLGREVAVHEGFKRVAVCARVGLPILSPPALGEPDIPDSELASPAVAATLPGLPAMFVDVRQISRAVQCPPDHPLAQQLDFAQTTPVSWRQLHPRGAPCFPGSYEDVSHRTVDIRPVSDGEGQAEPRRVLLFVAPALGFFDPRSPLASVAVEPSVTANDGDTIENRRIGTLQVASGAVTVTGCWIHEIDIAQGAQATVSESAIQTAQSSALPADPVLNATDSMFDAVLTGGVVELAYCTVIVQTQVAQLEASDCIFVGSVSATAISGNCVRYSRVPDVMPSEISQHANTSAVPIFLSLPGCASGDPTPQVPAWGGAGYGVLDPATPGSIRFGAEDGGEMGAYHADAFGLEDEALIEKTTDHLPLAVTPGLITDPRLVHVPPVIGTAS
jgi:hypothetical protein